MLLTLKTKNTCKYIFLILDKHEMFEDDYHHYAYNDKEKLVCNTVGLR